MSRAKRSDLSGLPRLGGEESEAGFSSPILPPSVQSSIDKAQMRQQIIQVMWAKAFDVVVLDQHFIGVDWADTRSRGRRAFDRIMREIDEADKK